MGKKKLSDDAISELIDEAVAAGRKLYKSRKYAEAHEVLAVPIQSVGNRFMKHPRAAEILMAIADVLFTSGKFQEALDAYDGVVGVGGDVTPYLQVRKGQILNDYADTTVLKQRGKRLSSEDAYVQFSCAWMNGGNAVLQLVPAKHRKLIRQTIDEDDDWVPEDLTEEELGRTFADIFRLPAARKEAPTTPAPTAVRPASALSLCKAAEAAVANGDLKEAEVAFAQAYERFDEGSKQVQRRLATGYGETLFQRGKTRKAIDPFHDAYNQKIDGHTLLRLGQCYFNARQKTKALDYLLRAYMLEGKAIFKGEDAKYFEYLASKVEL